MNPRNETLNHLMRHMAWANATFFRQLAQLPDSALFSCATGSDWSVGAIAHHLVTAAENYAQRLHGEPRAPERSVPTTVAELESLAIGLAAADAKLRAGAALDGAEVLNWISFNGDPVSFPRWVLVNQSVHHATEHRAQIAAALVANGHVSVDLDSIDVWSLHDEEMA